MKLTIFLFITVSVYDLFGQTTDRFRNFHGLRDPYGRGEFFEAEGYDIFTQSLDIGLDEKGISKIKKKFSLKGVQLTTDSILNIKALIGSKELNGVIAKSALYLIPVEHDQTTVIGFARVKTRDVSLERDFVNSFVSLNIPNFVYTKSEIDSIDFAGRTIQLGPICHWMAPHNIQCPDKGQMNWAIFDNLTQAEEYRDSRLEMAKRKTLTNIKDERWITIKFEGHETKALRTRVKIQLPKLIMGGSNVLVVYYVTGQVRGKYVTCILSHYTDDVNVNEKSLPPLLSEVIELLE
jgi:hypothetical protein